MPMLRSVSLCTTLLLYYYFFFVCLVDVARGREES